MEMTPEERSSIAQKIQVALEKIDKAVREHKPVAVFGMFSGGHDSFSASYVASLHPSLTGMVHINTGIGVEATRSYVRQTCKDRGWNLIEHFAAQNLNAKGKLDPQLYDEFVLKYGFPGPHGHGMMYARLKERALHSLARTSGASCRGKTKRRIMLISGCRSIESTRRMGNVEEVQVDGRRIWTAPIHDWTKYDTSLCLEYANQPRNEVVDLIHKSGECLCGAFAKPGELEELKLWPQTREAYDRIIALQERANAAGVHAVWGTRPPKEKKCALKPGMLCHSCK